MLLQVSNETDGVLNFTVQSLFQLKFTVHQPSALSSVSTASPLPIWNTTSLLCWECSFRIVGKFGEIQPKLSSCKQLFPMRKQSGAQLLTIPNAWQVGSGRALRNCSFSREQRGDPDTSISMKDLICLSHPLPQWTPLISKSEISFSTHLVYSAVPSMGGEGTDWNECPSSIHQCQVLHHQGTTE